MDSKEQIVQMFRMALCVATGKINDAVTVFRNVVNGLEIAEQTSKQRAASSTSEYDDMPGLVADDEMPGLVPLHEPMDDHAGIPQTSPCYCDEMPPLTQQSRFDYTKIPPRVSQSGTADAQRADDALIGLVITETETETDTVSVSVQNPLSSNTGDDDSNDLVEMAIAAAETADDSDAADSDDEDEDEADGSDSEEETVELNLEPVRIKKVIYWKDADSGDLYAYLPDDQVGDKVGAYVNGKPVLN